MFLKTNRAGVFIKLANSLLGLSLILSPISSVFAQEVASTSIDTPPIQTEIATTVPDSQTDVPAVDTPVVTPLPPSTDANPVPLLPLNEGDAIPVVENPLPIEETPIDENSGIQSMSSSGDPSGPSVQTNSILTYQNTAPKVDNTSGALTQRIQLTVPPGRNGVQPDLALEYNSQRTEQNSIVGYGWNVSIPYIERMNKTGIQSMYGPDPYFSSSLDGEVVKTSTSSNTYKAKVDAGQSLSYSYSSDTWTVYDKNGTRYLFGSSDQSRQAPTTTTSKISKWMLEEVRDTNDNYVKYFYTRDLNQVYPSYILYTGNGSTDGIFRIDFTTSTRTDPNISYKTGYRVATNNIISEISASVNGTWVKKYNLSYGVGNNGTRALLSGITEKGKNDVGTEITLPPTSFSYVSTTTQFVAQRNDPRLQGSAWIPADANGNGLNDITVSYYDGVAGNARGYVREDQVNDFTNMTSIPEYWAYTTNGNDQHPPQERGTRYLDINADGKADVVKGIKDDPTSTTTVGLYFNNYATSTGYSWVSTTTASTTIPSFAWTTANYNYLTTGIFGDVNGDGLPDFEQHVQGLNSGDSYLGNGTAWDTSTTTIYVPAARMPDTSGGPVTNSQLIDINGDGLDDWVSSDGGNTYVQTNTGLGWEATPDPRWNIATSTFYISPGSNPAVYYDRGARFLDINGDGLPDFVRSYSTPSYTTSVAPDIEIASVHVVLLNTGSGWATSTAYSLPGDIATGMVDSNIWSGVVKYSEYANWHGNGQHYQDVISNINYSRGGSTDVLYKPTATSTNPELPISFLAVSKITNNDNKGHSSETSYTYEGGKMYFAQGVRERKFAGFQKVTETNPTTIVKTYYNQGDSVYSALGEQSDGYAQIGRPYREDYIDPSNSAIVRQKFYRWDTDAVGSTTIVHLGRTIQQDTITAGGHADRAVEYIYATSTTNLIETRDYGQVTGNSDGTFTDTGTDKTTTSLSYASSTSINLYVPTRETKVDYNASTTKDTKLYYDSLSFGSVSLGNKTREESWIASTTYASTTKAYNSYGLVTSETDARGKTTSYSYDSYNLYPATVTNSLSQSNSYTYNYSNGKVIQSTDPNSRIYKNTYDGVGRVTQVEQSDYTTPSTLVIKTTIEYGDSTSTTPYIHTTNYLSSASTSEAYSYFDGLDRTIQERKKADDTSTTTVSDIVYGSNGLVNSQSLPYFSYGSSYTSPTTTPSLYTYLVYGPLDRVVQSGNSVGTTTTAYSGWSTTVTDPLSHVKAYNKDAFGNLTSVVERIVLTDYTTTYAYDTNNNLTKITDSMGNVRNFTYDGLNRRTIAEDLHATTDSTFGTWYYTYDDGGNIISQTDPKSQIVSYTYDSLSRPLTEDYAGQGGVETTYVYDSCSYGVGRLCTASTTNATSTYTYNVLGLVATETKKIGGVDYATTYTYDRQGNILSVTNPDSRVINYGYTSAGRLTSASSRPYSGSGTTIVSETRYSPVEQVGLRIYGNGLKTTNTYDQTRLYRLSNIFTATTTPSDNVSTSSQILISDDFNRADSGTIGGNWTDNTDTNNHLYIGSNKLYASWSSQPWDGFHSIYRGLSDQNNITISYKWRVQSGANVDAWLPLIGVRSSGANNDGSSYALGLQYVGQTDKVNLYVLDNGSTKASVTDVVVTPQKDTDYNVEIYINSQNHMEGRVWLTGTSRPSTPSISFTNGGSAYTPSANGSNIIILATHGSGANYSVMGSVDDFMVESGTGGSATTTSPTGIQNVSYTYDAVGNITKITDNSSTTLRTIVDYTYDDLNRLTNASTTDAVGSPYREVFAYNPIGNLISKTATDAGTITGSYLISDDFNRSDSSSIGGGWTDNTDTGDHIQINSNKYRAQWVSQPWDSHHSTYRSLSKQNDISISYKWRVQSGANVDGWLPLIGARSTGANNESSSYALGLLYVGQNDTASMYILDNGTIKSTATNVLSSTQKDTDYNVEIIINAQNHMEGRIWLASGQRPTNPSISFTNGGASYTPSANGSNLILYSTHGSSANYSVTSSVDDLQVSDNAAGGGGIVPTVLYSSTGYANPHAPTTFASSTITYDNNGNATEVGTSTHSYDYQNRLTQSIANNATTTYTYDHTTARVSQTTIASSTPTTTTTYISKFYSLTSTPITSTTTNATSTTYVYMGDTLVSTIDQPLINGTATGTAIVSYIHPNHLQSTNIVTNQNKDIIQSLDYLPYGAPRINAKITSIDSARKYIGQFADGTGLDYLNARYYDAGRGQFLSQDPVFWSIRQNLANPQTLNSYSYASDNPITKKDPDGLATVNGTTQAILAQLKSQLLGMASFIASLSTSGGRAQFASSVSAGASTVRSNPMGVAGNIASGIGQGVKQTYRDLNYGDDAAQDKALASSILFFGSLASPASRAGEAVSLAGRAREINGVLDPIAQNMRTTAVLRTSTGDIVASGGRDLSGAQITALRAGEMAANPMPGTHAEVTAITSALNSGSTPQTIGVSRAICSSCASYIQSTGGTLIDSFTAQW